jgi:hypothetical protein
MHMRIKKVCIYFYVTDVVLAKFATIRGCMYITGVAFIEFVLYNIVSKLLAYYGLRSSI